MRSWKSAIAALALLVLAAGVVLNLPSFDSNAAVRGASTTPGDLGATAERLRESIMPIADERLARIQHELVDLEGHAWAGQYGCEDADGASARLAISPQAGFVYFRTARDGSKDVNHGSVLSAKPTRIQIEPAIDPAQNEPRRLGDREVPPLDEDLVPVPWGARRYLVPKVQMQAFCNAVNAGLEAARPRFLFRQDDGGKSTPSGLPTVPDAYREWLLDAPIEGEIIQVVPATQAESKVKLSRPMVAVINVGRNAGVRPGMEFHSTSARGYDAAEVLECDDTTARIEFRLDVESVREIEALEVGWRVSTRAP